MTSVDPRVGSGRSHDRFSARVGGGWFWGCCEDYLSPTSIEKLDPGVVDWIVGTSTGH